MLHDVVSWLANAVDALGYTGVTLLMFLESSFFPFPSEVVVPPAGYLAAQGKMHLGLVVLAGTAGSLGGALFNYWLSLRLGRAFLFRYGRYLFISHKSLTRAEAFFTRHGHISTFIGRLVPGVRQYISLPAGIARMPLFLFCCCTSLGAGIWVVILALAGYWVGGDPQAATAWLHSATLWALAASGGLVLLYILYTRRKRRIARRQEVKE